MIVKENNNLYVINKKIILCPEVVSPGEARQSQTINRGSAMTDVELEVDALIVGGMAPELLRLSKMRFYIGADESDMDAVTIDDLVSNIVKDSEQNEYVLVKGNNAPRELAAVR